MQALTQNIAIGAALFFLLTMVLRQIPVVGFFVRMLTRVLFLFSPIVLIVLLVGVIWFHGANLFTAAPGRTASTVAPVSSAAPAEAPLPSEAPR